MTTTVTTKKGIVLLSSLTLTTIIAKIEKTLPGYWYSISQKTGSVTLTAGPSDHCPSANDVLFAASDKGSDTTITMPIIHFAADQENVIFSWVDNLFAFFAPKREQFQRLYDTKQADYLAAVAKAKDSGSQETIAPVVTLQPSWRSQSEDALTKLATQYDALLDHITTYEAGGFIFDEVYLGSCELSVDCSLRGLDPTGKEFDYSVDFQGDAIIADSLEHAEAELIAAIGVHQDTEAKAKAAAEAAAPEAKA